MNKNKNIDRIFQENFRDFEVYPSNKVWKGIEKELKKNSKSRVLPLWQRFSGVAVAFLLLFSLGYTYFKPFKKQRTEIGDINFSDKNHRVAEQPSTKIPLTKVYQKTLAEIDVDKATKKTGSTKNKVTPDLGKITGKLKFSKTKINDLVVTEPEIIPVTENKGEPADRTVPVYSQKDIRDVQNESVAQITKPKIDLDKKWSVGANVSPVYMNSFTKGSPLSPDLANNSTVTDEALSYGVKFDYKLTKKFRVQSGINKVGLSYNTKNVDAYVTTAKNVNNFLDTDNQGIKLAPSSGSRVLSDTQDLRGKAGLTGDLNQSFDYLEIPLEIKYNLYDSRVGLNLVGGFSTFILIDNQVSIISPFSNNQTYLGRANNVNTMNFSGNFGLDLDYKISKDWFLNVTPMMKYQFNTFSVNPGNFQPFYLGVYSGINYKF